MKYHNSLCANIDNLNNATYDPFHDRYDVTELVRGPFYDVLKLLEKSLNFTTKMFKRRIEGWGIPRLHPNGTMELSPGMVKDVASGSADLIIASLSIMYER